MTRLIDADKLITAIKEEAVVIDINAKIKRVVARGEEFLPVIRCKDCRWGREVCGNIECNFDELEYHGYDWYCANGDKKNV